MNSKLYMIGLIGLSLWGLNSLNESKADAKTKKILRITYILIITATVMYFFGYEIGKTISHLSH